jgi:hypothetical protein
MIRPLCAVAVFIASVLLAAPLRAAEATIEVVVAYEQGLQITAPQQWLQLITRLGIDRVQLRATRAGDAPDIETLGTADRPRYRLTGVIDNRNRLVLPGGRFSMNDAAKLRTYLDNLAGDGAAGVLAEKGRFGLTNDQFRALFEQLQQSPGIATAGRPVSEVISDYDERLGPSIELSAEAREQLGKGALASDDASSLTAGTALALVLREANLALVPSKQTGSDVVLQVVPLTAELADHWPVGWPAEGDQRRAAPGLFEYVTIEVADYTIKQAVDAIAPRIKVPVFWDHHTLQSQPTDPRLTKVKMAEVKSYHKRILDRLLFQARLRGAIRVDEAGTTFYWIGK